MLPSQRCLFHAQLKACGITPDAIIQRHKLCFFLFSWQDYEMVSFQMGVTPLANLQSKIVLY